MSVDATTSVSVRAAVASDAPAVAAIHNQGIEDRAATFETSLRSPDDVLPRIGDPSQPLLVAEVDGRVAGWAGAVRSNDRCAQSGVGEYTIYVERDMRGRGIGTPLLEALAAEAERRGYWKLIAKIFTTNSASIALARRCGFREVGVHERHGRIDGSWRDVLLVERLLGEDQDSRTAR